MKAEKLTPSFFPRFFRLIRKKIVDFLFADELASLETKLRQDFSAKIQKLEANRRELILEIQNLQKKTEEELLPWLSNLQEKTEKELLPWLSNLQEKTEEELIPRLHEFTRKTSDLVEIRRKTETLYFDRYGSLGINYLEYENVFRGDVEDIKKRFLRYLPYFDGIPGYILDLGCGRGEMLQLLTEHGFECKGVDCDQDMVQFCHHLCLNVDLTDAISYLENAPDESIGAIFIGQLVEHLGSRIFVKLMRLCQQKLMRNGVLLYETLDPESPDFLKYFYMDFSHVFPINPHSAEYLLKTLGWQEVRRVPTYFPDVDYAMFARK